MGAEEGGTPELSVITQKAKYAFGRWRVNTLLSYCVWSQTN